MQFRTFSDLNNIINKKVNLIPSDIDLIVGIPRSGMLPASIISLLRNIPLVDFNTFIEGKIYSSGDTKKKKDWIQKLSDANKILIVEDSCCSGSSIKKAKEIVKKMNLKSQILYLAIYCTNLSKCFVDFYFEIVNEPREFEWNYLHHDLLEKTCFDIDGVLCIDPTEEQNDDGIMYREFIKNAPLRVSPTKAIGYLVTSRLEKYRELTEFWLSKNNINFKKMFMMQYKTKEERLLYDNHAEYKANIYKSLKDTILFVESDSSQAEIINKISKKSVFCIENQKFYPASAYLQKKEESVYKNESKIKSMLKNTLLWKLLRKIKHIFK